MTKKIESSSFNGGTRMSFPETFAVTLGWHLFCYRSKSATIWRSAFYDPRRQRSPQAWLRARHIAADEIDMAPQVKPADVSDEAWDWELRRRAPG